MSSCSSEGEGTGSVLDSLVKGLEINRHYAASSFSEINETLLAANFINKIFQLIQFLAAVSSPASNPCIFFRSFIYQTEKRLSKVSEEGLKRRLSPEINAASKTARHKMYRKVKSSRI